MYVPKSTLQIQDTSFFKKIKWYSYSPTQTTQLYLHYRISPTSVMKCRNHEQKFITSLRNVTEPIFRKFMSAKQICVSKSYSAFHENPTNGSVAEST